ncbi:MAG: superoxide dismutase [Desulfuromonas sp.]|nr:superoxide dismutase [Desulfuromonas sp.]
MINKLSVLALALFCATVVMATTGLAQPFALPALPYANDALEPYMDKLTVDIHHGLHHQGYVNNLNAQVKTFPKLEGMTLEAIMAKVSTFNAAVRGNGGGHYNHDFFWKSMAPAGKGGEPSAELISAINYDFGSLGELKKQFNQAGLTRLGSGWAWLIVTPEKKLAITATANQDNPLMDIAEVKGTPILVVDVWEHAYYLSYQNRRASFLNQWWPLVNWNEVNSRFAKALR